MAELQRRYDGLLQVIAERAAHPDYQGLPGGKTGLLVRRLKVIGRGEQAREVVEYEVDTGLLKEMREILNQAAVEVGDRVKKLELSGKVQMNDVQHLTDDELERIAASGR